MSESGQKDPRKLIEYIDTFFGVRNNIKGDPKENINYTVETLTYMTSHNRADQITQMIVDRMKNIVGDKKFGLFECCSGIGGNALSFLENPQTEWVVSYEINPERREMLKRNIAMYGLGSKSFVPDGGFTGVPEDYKGVVLYFDPPWLPPHIKGHESTKDQYILEGITVAGKTLEEWAESCKHCSMIVARVPPGYRLKPIPGYNVDSILLKNSLVLFITPETIKAIQPITTKEIDSDYQRWREGLKNYLYNDLLSIVVPKEEQRVLMISDPAMDIWVLCFTDESFNPNVGQNYEELELVGDHSMEFNFIKYLYKNVPGITRAEMSEIKSKYISKTFQSKTALELGMNKWVRSRVKITTHVFEDVLEAYFGGLDTVADMVFKPGAGNLLCYNMIVYMFRDITITKEMGQRGERHPKTEMKELFERMFWGEVVEDARENEDGTVSVTVSLTPEGSTNLTQLGVQVTTPVLGEAVGRNKKMTFRKAYDQGMKVLRGIGLTEEWIDAYRGNRDETNPELAPYIPALKQLLSNDGFTSFKFQKVKAGKEGKMVQLIGIKADGTLVPIAQNDKLEKNELEAKKQTLINYTSGKKL